MKNFEFGQTASILANIGVLAGLLLVAVQINQNTEIARAQLANDYYLADMQLELAMMGEAPVESWIKAVWEPATLTAADAAVLDRYFNIGMVQVRRLREMAKIGLADEQLLAEQIAYLEWHLGNDVGRRWWVQYKSDEPDGELVQLVDRALSKSDYAQNREYLDGMMMPAGTR